MFIYVDTLTPQKSREVEIKIIEPQAVELPCGEIFISYKICLSSYKGKNSLQNHRKNFQTQTAF